MTQPKTQMVYQLTSVDCLAPSARICDGCADAAELQGANCDPVSGFPCCSEWQGHGGDCTDWLWKDTRCKDEELLSCLMMTLYCKSSEYLYLLSTFHNIECTDS